MIDKERLRASRLFDLIVTPEEAANHITDGMIVGLGGFTAVGCPKELPVALASRESTGSESISLNVLSGGSVGPEVENLLAGAGIVKRRAPGTLAVYKPMQTGVNSGEIAYCDYHYSHMPQMLDYGFMGPVDVAVIEATAITADGNIIPTTSVGSSPTFARIADKIIVEINVTQPLELEGFHDLYTCSKPPKRAPIPILKPDDRIGTKYLIAGFDKIAAIVESNRKDQTKEFKAPDEDSKMIAEYLIDFLKSEIRAGRMPEGLLPIQSGFGNVGNAILDCLMTSEFENLELFTELAQPALLKLIENGKVKVVSCSALSSDKHSLESICNDPQRYKKNFILRPLEICNHPELIRRLGIIAINTPLEVDIYGNANSTHLMGSKMVNTIGGSGDFMRNAYLSIFTTPSTAKNKKISRIIPMVSHVDHTEHDWHVLITEHGIADLRGLSPRERAESIINQCADPLYRPQLRDYLLYAMQKGGHTPHDLESAFSFYKDFEKDGTMLHSHS